MGADEVGTLAGLKELRRQIVDPLIAEHRDRIVKITGDGMLVEFASALDARDLRGSRSGEIGAKNFRWAATPIPDRDKHRRHHHRLR